MVVYVLADGLKLRFSVGYRSVSTTPANVDNQILLLRSSFRRHLQLLEGLVDLSELGMIDDTIETCWMRAQV